MQTWGDGQHTLPEGPGGLHAQEAGGCHQKGWQHHQVLVPTFYLNFLNSNCLIYVKKQTICVVNSYLAGCKCGLHEPNTAYTGQAGHVRGNFLGKNDTCCNMALWPST